MKRRNRHGIIHGGSSMFITRLIASNRRAALAVVIVSVIQYLCFQFNSLQSIIHLVESDYFALQHQRTDDHNATTRSRASNVTLSLASDASCSWTAPTHDPINSNMDWAQHHFNHLFRRLESKTDHQPVCPERRLLNAAVPYYIYPQQQLFSDPRYYLEYLSSNNLSKSPLVKPEYHRVDARYENYIFQALYNHSQRVAHMEDAQLFVIPIPFGALCFDTLTSFAEKRVLYNEIRYNLLNSTPYQQGKPHVLISMTNPIFDFHRRKNVRFGKLYNVVSNMTVARGDDHYVARFAHLHNITPTIHFRGFDTLFSTTQPVTQYTFSVGLGGQAVNLPLIQPTWNKFQQSSLFLFYHTRTSPPFQCDSGTFREAPIMNVSSTALPRSSIGWSIPWEQWNREIVDSKFCLVVRGDTPHSHSLFNVIKVGCIPVVISDWYPFYAPPFPATLDMRDFCIFISEGDFINNPEETLTDLRNISDHVIKEKLKALQWAQRVMMVDHPNSLFVPAFIREALNSFSRPTSQLFVK